MATESFSDPVYVSSIIFNVYNLSESHKIGCAWPVRHPGEDARGSANVDEVILLYIEAFLIR